MYRVTGGHQNTSQRNMVRCQNWHNLRHGNDPLKWYTPKFKHSTFLKVYKIHTYLVYASFMSEKHALTFVLSATCARVEARIESIEQFIPRHGNDYKLWDSSTSSISRLNVVHG